MVLFSEPLIAAAPPAPPPSLLESLPYLSFLPGVHAFKASSVPVPHLLYFLFFFTLQNEVLWYYYTMSGPKKQMENMLIIKINLKSGLGMYSLYHT